MTGSSFANRWEWIVIRFQPRLIYLIKYLWLIPLLFRWHNSYAELAITVNGSTNPIITLGQTISINVSSSLDSYLYCFYSDNDQTWVVIYPSNRDLGQIRKDQPIIIPSSQQNFTIIAENKSVFDRLTCVTSLEKIHNLQPLDKLTDDKLSNILQNLPKEAERSSVNIIITPKP